MSEAAKPVEEPVVAPEAAVEAPAAETAPAETTEAATDAPAAPEPAAAEEAAIAPKEEKPVEEGALGYKGPGLLKSFIFQKKFFWFGTEPVEHKSLTSYLRGEKQQELANKNAAWSSHTGKGLLYFSKKATEKASPAGIINLAEVSDLTQDGTVDFSFSLGGHKHTFQANTSPERDSWLAALKTKIDEAKELATTVTESDEYKKSLGELTKLVGPAVAAPKKSVDVKEDKKEEKAEDKEEKKEEKKEVKEEKEARKSRSASRKRNSIFSFGGLGKKEEKPEVAKEETPVVAATEEPVAPTGPVATEPVTAVPETTEAPATETAVAAPAEPKPAPSKRNSIFGSLKSSFGKEKKPSTEAPVVPPKDVSEPVSDSAPVIPPVDTSETPAAEATEVPATNGETKAAEPPAPKTRKGSSSLPWLSKKEKPATSDEEAEKPKSPFAKLRATVKGKSSPKAEKAPEKPAEAEAAKEEAAAPVEAAPAAVDPVVSEPVPVVQQTPAPVAASA